MLKERNLPKPPFRNLPIYGDFVVSFNRCVFCIASSNDSCKCFWPDKIMTSLKKPFIFMLQNVQILLFCIIRYYSDQSDQKQNGWHTFLNVLKLYMVRRAKLTAKSLTLYGACRLDCILLFEAKFLKGTWYYNVAQYLYLALLVLGKINWCRHP